MRVCLAANARNYSAGGHLWAYLNWALSLRALGCEVVWLETTAPDDEPTGGLEHELVVHGLELVVGEPDERALDSDLLIDLAYLPGELARRFRRSALVDIDPGFTQLWGRDGDLDLSGHDAYFTIGAGVADGSARVPDCGLRWLATVPPVALDAWTPAPPPAPGAPYTTVSHWWEDGTGLEVDGRWVESAKRAGFTPILDLPGCVTAALELALGGLDDESERRALERRGWRVRDAASIGASTDAHRDYVRASRGELSAAKPPYVALRTGWISDRTPCYLACGRPAIVEDTGGGGPADDAGLLRFADLAGAADALARVEADYDAHARAARLLAQERFDGRRVVGALIERALP